MSALSSKAQQCFVWKGNASQLSIISRHSEIYSTQNAEICKRFSTLVSRYLNLVTHSVLPEVTLSNYKTSSSSSDKYLCDACVPVAESFCQMHDVWFCLRLELNRCLEKIAVLIPQIKDVNHGEEVTIKRELPAAPSKSPTETHQDFREAFLQRGNPTHMLMTQFLSYFLYLKTVHCVYACTAKSW